MTECRKYLTILIESLEKKIDILDQLLDCNERQSEVIKANLNLDEFEKIVDEKGGFIDSLNRIDLGFQSVYDRIKVELIDNKQEYKKEIEGLQRLISQIAEKSVALETSELRNKQAVENYFSFTRNQLQLNKKNVKAASDYYKSMSQVNYVDSQMIDKKK